MVKARPQAGGPATGLCASVAEAGWSDAAPLAVGAAPLSRRCRLGEARWLRPRTV